LKVVIILYVNFLLATRLPRTSIPAATWIFNIGILFANELGKGYRYATFAQLLSPGSALESGAANWGTWLDSYGGLVPRWEILFNITVLRLISFNLDYYWSLDYRSASPVEVSTYTYIGRHSAALIASRRSKSRLLLYRSVIVSTRLDHHLPTASQITCRMLSIRHYTLLVLS